LPIPIGVLPQPNITTRRREERASRMGSLRSHHRDDLATCLGSLAEKAIRRKPTLTDEQLRMLLMDESPAVRVYAHSSFADCQLDAVWHAALLARVDDVELILRSTAASTTATPSSNACSRTSSSDRRRPSPKSCVSCTSA
jgi:hypothetical protein